MTEGEEEGARGVGGEEGCPEGWKLGRAFLGFDSQANFSPMTALAKSNDHAPVDSIRPIPEPGGSACCH